MNAFLRDVRHSIRMFLGSPGFTITAVAALALGIGAVTAIFSIVDTVLLRPLPVADADRLVVPMVSFVNENGQNGSSPIASPAKFEFWRTQSSVLQYVSAFTTTVMNYTGGEVAEQLHSMQASADVFRCWEIPILRGRGFSQGGDLPDVPRVGGVGKRLWARRFASDPQILG